MARPCGSCCHSDRAAWRTTCTSLLMSWTPLTVRTIPSIAASVVASVTSLVTVITAFRHSTSIGALLVRLSRSSASATCWQRHVSLVLSLRRPLSCQRRVLARQQNGVLPAPRLSYW